MDGAGVDRAVVVPMKPPGYHLAPANDRVAAAVAERPERLCGLARVDPNLGAEAVEELERALVGARSARSLPPSVGGDVQDQRPEGGSGRRGRAAPRGSGRRRRRLSVALGGAPGRRAGPPLPGRALRRDERRADQHFGSRPDGRRARADGEPQPLRPDRGRLPRGLPRERRRVASVPIACSSRARSR